MSEEKKDLMQDADSTANNQETSTKVPEGNTKGNKWKIMAVCEAAVIVVVLIIVLAVLGNKNKGDNNSTTAVNATEETKKVVELENKPNEVTTEASKEETKENDTTAQTLAVKDDTLTENSGDIKVSFVEKSKWEAADKQVAQYDIVIDNTSDEPVVKWEYVIELKDGQEISQAWNCEMAETESGVIIRPVSYTSKVEAKSSMESAGLIQVQWDKKDDFDIASGSFRYTSDEDVDLANVNNEETTEEAKENASKTEEAKEDNKEDKNEEKKDVNNKGSKNPVAEHGALAVKYTDLVDSKGEKFQLKGVSTHGLQWFPQYVTKDTFATLLNDYNVNTIRLAMYTGENGYCTGGNKAELKKLVENGVDYATELGMYAIIDWHILSDNNPNIYKSEAITFFDEMSKKYSGNNNVIYEICNEPNGGTSWSDVKSYATEVIAAIRKNDKNAVILVGTPNWSQFVDEAAKDRIANDDNVMYVLHFYAATHKDDLRNKLIASRAKGLPIFISEFSICDASGNGGIDYNSASAWLDLINDYNLSYVGWNLSNKNETSSLISSSCNKVSGFKESDLSETGKWLFDSFK